MEKLHGVVLPLVLDLLDTRKIHFTRFFLATVGLSSTSTVHEARRQWKSRYKEKRYFFLLHQLWILTSRI